MSIKFAIAAAILAGSASMSAEAAPMFSDIVVLGDSLSDTGNIKAQLGGFPLIANAAGYGGNGRFSNGLVWHEYLATSLGLEAAAASLNGGKNYAYGGAEVDDNTSIQVGVLEQRDQYLTSVVNPDPAALHIAWAGGNDVRGVVGNVDASIIIAARLDAYRTVMTDLLDSGVETLLVPNLPDLGSIPEFAGGANSASATAATMAWNDGLAEMLLDVSGNYEASIFYFDVFDLFQDLLAQPADYGFVNVSDECRSVAVFGFVERECANANTYVFWDEIHPTTAAHSLLGARAFDMLMNGAPMAQQVPAPAVLLLFGLGLGGLGFARRRQQRVA